MCRLERAGGRYGWSNVNECKLCLLLYAPPSRRVVTAPCTLHAIHSHCYQVITGSFSWPPSTPRTSTYLAICGQQGLRGCHFTGAIPWRFLVTRTRHASTTFRNLPPHFQNDIAPIPLLFQHHWFGVLPKKNPSVGSEIHGRGAFVCTIPSFPSHARESGRLFGLTGRLFGVLCAPN